MDKFLKILDFVLVIAAIVLAVYVGKNIGLEYLMRGREEPVTLSMTEGGLPEDYIGRPAGGDIPLIEDGHSWEEAWATDYITIQPVGIVSTGVGALHPWVDAYTTPTRRNRGGWKAPVIPIQHWTFSMNMGNSICFSCRMNRTYWPSCRWKRQGS